MKPYRYSPIKNKEKLFEAIKYTHIACHKLCRQSLSGYLPVAGNVGIFCHYEDEYKLLTKIREEITEASDNFNQKYYRLISPIVIDAENGIPKATYAYLYIRQPDSSRSEVGDVDFILNPNKYIELKKSLINGKKIKGIKTLSRTDIDMLELFDPDVDVLGYVTTTTMAEKVRVKQ